MLQFNFDANAGETPASVAQKRALVAQILGTAKSPSNVGEGFSAIGDGIVANVEGGRAREAEAAGLASANDTFGALTAMLTGQGGASPAGGFGSSPSVPSTADAAAIRAGLIERGLPEHIADGFLMNFQDESGLNPGINEQNPIVPGSRGGYGLYQLTGPRRVAYEQYAQQLGVDPSNVDAQLDFLISELQGPEAKAAQSILAAPDAGSAAAAIARDFLRPAQQHLDERVARYTAGGAPVRVASLDASLGLPQQTAPQQQAPVPRPPMGMIRPGNIDPSNRPVVQNPDGTISTVRTISAGVDGQETLFPTVSPDGQIWSDDEAIANGLSSGQDFGAFNSPQAANAFAERLHNTQAEQYAQPRPAAPPPRPAAPAPVQKAQGPDLAMLMEAAANPWLSDSQKSVINSMIAQQMQQQDPAYQLGLEKLGLEVAGMRNPQPDPGFRVLTAEEAAKMNLPEGAYQVGPDNKVYEIGGGGVNVTLPGQPNIGTIPAGYSAVQDENGAWTMAPIPGSPAALEQEAADNKDGLRDSIATVSSDTVVDQAAKARALIGGTTTGMGGWLLGNLPFSDAADMYRYVSSLKSTAAAENINQMRQSSPTGGALGNASDADIKLLQDKAGALDPASPRFPEMLDDYERTLLRIIHGAEAGDRMFTETRPGYVPTTTPASDGAVGIDALLEKYQ